MALWLGALLIGFYFTSNTSNPDDQPVELAATTAAPVATDTPAPATTVVAPTTEPTSTTGAGTTTTTTTPAETTPTVADPALFVAPSDGPWLQATLEAGQFRLEGRIPSSELESGLTQAATLVYGPGAEVAVEIDETIGSAEWLAGAPQGITLLPVIGTGSIGVSNDGVVVSGVSPNEQQYAAFEQAALATFGVDSITSGVEIANLGYPSFNTRRVRDSVVITGELANETDRGRIIDGAIAVYGDTAVDDQTTIGENLDTPFWTYTMPGVFALLEPFPDYEIDIRNGITSGSLNDGANFATGSAELSESTRALMSVAIAILTRDPTLGILIEGHTDSIGDAAFNQTLSERRAQSAADFMITAGIDAGRIVTVGYGEDRPIADNDTAAGRAQNRRVAFAFGPLQDILATG